MSVVEQRERGYSIRRILKHKAEIEVDEFVRRIKLLFIKHTRFIYGLLLTKENLRTWFHISLVYSAAELQAEN